METAEATQWPATLTVGGDRSHIFFPYLHSQCLNCETVVVHCCAMPRLLPPHPLVQGGQRWCYATGLQDRLTEAEEVQWMGQQTWLCLKIGRWVKIYEIHWNTLKYQIARGWIWRQHEPWYLPPILPSIFTHSPGSMVGAVGRWRGAEPTATALWVDLGAAAPWRWDLWD